MEDNKNESEVSFRNSIKKDSTDMLNMRNSPGDRVWESFSNVLKRKRPIRFFDIFVGFFILVFVLAFIFALAISFLG